MRGQALVEFALVLPILVVVLFGIAQWAILMNALATVNHAAQAGAHVGAAIGADPSRTASGDVDTDIRDAVQAEQGVLAIADANITVEPTVAQRASGSILTVTVTYRQPIFVPAMAQIAGNVLTVTSRSVARVE